MSQPPIEDGRRKAGWAVLGGVAGSLVTTLAFVLFLISAGYIHVSLPSFGGSGGDVSRAPIKAEGALLFRMAGSNTIGADLAPLLAQAFLKTQGYTDLKIGRREGSAKSTDQVVVGRSADGAPGYVEVVADGSATAPPALADGSADVGMMSTPMKDEQAAMLTGRFGGDPRAAGAEHVIGLDGVAVIVNPPNGVQQLSVAKLGLALSTATSWSQLPGGGGGPIKVERRDDNSGTYDTIKTLVLQPAGLTISPTSQPFTQSTALVQAVAADPGAIGFVGVGFVTSAVRALQISAEEGGPAITPSARWIKLELYPLSRRLYLYAPEGRGKPIVDAFLKFVGSPAAGEVVQTAGFIPLDVELIPNADALPLARDVAGRDPLGQGYLQSVASADRLSLNFHFAPDGGLDTRASADVQRLAAYLRASGGSSARLILVAFADPGADDPEGAGRADAGAVAQALSTAGGLAPSERIVSGGVSKIAAGDSAAARSRDRRVEVWITR